jgi:hypothetical protein
MNLNSETDDKNVNRNLEGNQEGRFWIRKKKEIYRESRKLDDVW